MLYSIVQGRKLLRNCSNIASKKINHRESYRSEQE